MPSNNSIRDCARGLVIANNPVNPTYKVDMCAQEIILEDISYNPLWVNNVTVTIDITQNGVNGLDVGQVAPNQWYYVWVISRGPSQTAGLLSLSPDSPILPQSYHYLAFAGAIQTDGAGNFNSFNQVGKTVARNAVCVLNSGTASVPTAVDCSSALPKKAVKAIGDYSLNLGAGGGRGEGWLRSRSNQGVVGFAGYLSTPDYLTMPFNLPVVESQTLYYNRSAASNAASVTVSISGFEF
jgi:hypothetical protein